MSFCEHCCGKRGRPSLSWLLGSAATHSGLLNLEPFAPCSCQAASPPQLIHHWVPALSRLLKVIPGTTLIYQWCWYHPPLAHLPQPSNPLPVSGLSLSLLSAPPASPPLPLWPSLRPFLIVSSNSSHQSQNYGRCGSDRDETTLTWSWSPCPIPLGSGILRQHFSNHGPVSQLPWVTRLHAESESGSLVGAWDATCLTGFQVMLKLV